ncbi:MAG: NADPH-dependent reductase [Flavipsychrobacter sp.]|nr:NADPH-dependent reductase [Flavipsychrobacter sp.]
MYNLKIIAATTRPGRKSPEVAAWILEIAEKHGGFEVELLDLAAINLPMMDEPEHPRMQRYTQEHTKAWSRTINDADAFIIVTAEYNHGYPAPLKNALDYLYNEWTYKPVAFVSYGGVAAGTRAVQQLKPVVAAQKMVPVVESVNVPFFTKYITEDDRFVGDEGLEKSAHGMLAELAKWAEALKPMRNK